MKTLLKVVYLMLASFCSCSINAQTKYPSIINLSADSKQMEGIIWDWSFGEQLMVHTLYSSKNLILTTGFLQNDFGVGVDYKLLALTSPFKIGPNPFIQNLKINSDGMITPCCYVSTALGWASGMRDTHPIDGYITDSGNHGDDINPLMKEFVDRRDDFTLGKTQFETILKDSWFSKQLEESFKSRPAFACKKVCSIC